MSPHKLGRSWGTRFDSLTSSGSLSSNADSVLESSHRAVSPPRSISMGEGHSTQDAHDKIVQDASIFIGSLPSNIEHTELMNMLIEHLSEHSEVQSVKVVRDSKGGTCAFIQCQDAEAASTLMNNLHSSPPQPFLGRYLRYEPARAFRTLLISYRSPRQYIRQREASRRGNLALEDQKFVELELPTAVRIVRTPGMKPLTILYNADALDNPSVGGADSGLLLIPLLFDAESLMRITSIFGNVEYFGPYAYGNEDGQPSVSFPAPHDAPRSPVMDPGCWRVKWANRDDCVSALMTLRRIPHLTVTWAHQSSMATREQRAYNNARALSAAQAVHSWRGRPVGHGMRSSSAFLPPSHTFPALHGNTEGSSVVQHPHDANAVDPSLPPSPGENEWAQETDAIPNNRAILLSRSARPRALSLTHDRPRPNISLPSRESTGQLSFTAWESSNRTRWTDHAESLEVKNSPRMAGSAFNTSQFRDPHKAVPSESSCHVSQEDDGQEIEAGVSPTPELGASPITPRTPGSLMLRTPTTASYMGDFQSASFREYESQGSLSHLSYDKRDDIFVDPTTIFVGGLEMFGPNAWDEVKVRAVFSKYGGIETVRVIRPSNKRSAFAFVKFNNIESAAKAVKAEHNQILNGRLIRVQLRDWNPAYRPPWRPGPKRELDSQSLGDEFSVDPSLSRPGIINIATQISNLRLTDTPAQPAPSFVDESCDLNEVEDDAKILRPEVPSQTAPDNPEFGCNDMQKIENSMIIKQSESVSPDITSVPLHNPVGPTPLLPPPYSAPSVQYYHGWIPGYAPHLPYQIPFPGQPYAAYAFPSPVVATVHQGGGSDGSGTPSSTPIPFGPPVGPYPPFTPCPPLPNQASESGPAGPGPLGVTNHPTLLHAQAPLIPTGFIQGDQGMLVPVYPPDALNQYMAGNQEAGQVPNNTSGSADAQLPVAWRAYPPSIAPIRPQAVIFHPYINPPMPLVPPGPPQMGAWMPGHPWQGAPPQLGNPHVPPTRRFSSSPSRGPPTLPMGANFERHGNLPPRRQYRRDNHNQHNKNNFARGGNGRFGKASFDSSRYPPDIQPVPAPQIAAPDTPVDGGWQQWGTDQGNLP